MDVYEDIGAWRHARRTQRRAGLSLGFVPTMGALHDGHRSLVERGRQENDHTLVSIFVNPAQFDDPSDLARYPRTLEADLALLESAGASAVLVPGADAVYRDAYRYRVVETVDSQSLEGAHRPGHFDGVLTVVLKLLHIADADRAYFGEKDWQQYRLVADMVEALFLPTAIVSCPTVREPDGLAMSSRNRRLSPADRARAPRLYDVLVHAASSGSARTALIDEGFDVDYIEDRDGRRLAAVRLGGVRLIDNVPRPAKSDEEGVRA